MRYGRRPAHGETRLEQAVLPRGAAGWDIRDRRRRTAREDDRRFEPRARNDVDRAAGERDVGLDVGREPGDGPSSSRRRLTRLLGGCPNTRRFALARGGCQRTLPIQVARQDLGIDAGAKREENPPADPSTRHADHRRSPSLFRVASVAPNTFVSE